MRAWMVVFLVATDAAAAPPGDRGDLCKTSADCAWDDPCRPARCVDAKQARPAACEKAAPAPGTCTCVEDMCTLRPEDPAHGVSSGSCTRDDECAIDVASATCHAGGTTLIGPIHVEGSLCTCDGKDHRCRFTWSEPVPCKSWKDCSWVSKPRLRPVPSSKVKRPVKRQVRPCKDAEVDSICTPEGVCKMVGWGC